MADDKEKKGFLKKLKGMFSKQKKEKADRMGDTLWAIDQSTDSDSYQQEQESDNEGGSGSGMYESELDKMFKTNKDNSMYFDQGDDFDDGEKETFRIKYRRWEYGVIAFEIVLVIYTILVFTKIIPF